ncbi:MAG: hypothetical protein HYX20_02780 [Candidatus Yanofskybacteria bacterium]|nr:hypothetical protein [Candidatus Yanofskybacteria bacterium]
MRFNLPKDNDKYQWTNHVKDKMLYYGISESLIKRIVRFPKRREDGVAPKTIAVMQPTSSKKQEIWVMFQEIQNSPKESLRDPTGQAKLPRPYANGGAGKNQNDADTLNEKRMRINLNGNAKFKNYQKLETNHQQPKMRIISAWRYPGVSPVGKKIPIPEEILSAVAEMCGEESD